jgi:proteasome lid subunit RPN8/RPN11
MVVRGDTMSEQQDRIVFGEPYDGMTLPEEAMPVHSWPAGKGNGVPLDSPFQVFFTLAVLNAMWQHARRSPELECAGGLFGHPFVQPATTEQAEQPITFVIAAVAVPYDTPEQAQGHVRVTADALEAADTYIARDYSGLRPVGWYHTHPGHGIFLSGYDRTITHSIFNAAWHVAVVLDPLRKQIGLFRGPDGERLSGYRLLRDLPLELILMQRYNRGCAAVEAGRLLEAQRRLRQVDILYQRDRRSLPFWRGRSAYRDVDHRLRQLDEALQDLSRPALPPPPCDFDETEETRKLRATPRPFKDRIADRTLEVIDGIARFPGRVLKGTRSTLSRLAGGGD